jgi:hypothetical protein
MVAELMGKTMSCGGIRMLDDGGRGQLVTPAQDVRVEAVAVMMAVIAGEISSALKAHGWSIVRADQTCELAGGLSSGEKHSIDLLWSKEGATVSWTANGHSHGGRKGTQRGRAGVGQLVAGGCKRMRVSLSQRTSSGAERRCRGHVDGISLRLVVPGRW